MIATKKWAAILSKIEGLSSVPETIEDCAMLLDSFESIPKDYRDNEAQRSYQIMSEVALRLGNLKLADMYAKIFLQYLIDYKRIPQIKFFINRLCKDGFFKNAKKDYLLIGEILLGKGDKIATFEQRFIDFFLNHPEHWKQNSCFLQQYLVSDKEWAIDQWKLCYEFVLLNSFDKEIFLILLEKASELEKKLSEEKFIELFKSKKIKVPRTTIKKEVNEKFKDEELSVDYDLMAMNLLSGAIGPSDEEQKRVINSLKFISEEELQSKGPEMIVAFELLGMEQVVILLCEKIITQLSDVKQRAGIYYVWTQALSNNGDFYKSLDLIEDVIAGEPLFGEECLAFLYLKAEIYLKLKKLNKAKELYLEIKKQNPYYRLVKERLKEIEKIK